MYAKIIIPVGATDQEIRKLAVGYFNGEYITSICRCGCYTSSLEGKTEDAKIIDKCSCCIDE